MQDKNNIILFYGTQQNTKGTEYSDWIKRLTNHLSITLHRLIGKETSVTAYTGIENIKTFLKDAILMILLTKEALTSNAFLKELDELYDLLPEQKKSQPKVFVLFKHPVRNDILPEWIHTTPSVNLFDVSSNTRKVTEFNFDTSTKQENDKFWIKLVNLAYSIKNIYNPESKNKTRAPNIFLAQTTADQEENREIIKRELLLRGFNILPELNSYQSQKNIEKLITKDISQSSVSIHILGNSYGEYLPHSQYSLIDLQNRIAKQIQQEDKKIKRIIWVPNENQVIDQRQQLYISRLQRNETDAYTEIVFGSIDQLRKVILKLLHTNDNGKANNEQKANIYYMSEKNNSLSKQTISLFENSNIKLNQITENKNIATHFELLINADGVIIEQSENELWFQTMISDVVKSIGYGKSRVFKTLIVTGNNKPDEDIELFGNKFEFINTEQLNKVLPEKLSALTGK